MVFRRECRRHDMFIETPPSILNFSEQIEMRHFDLLGGNTGCAMSAINIRPLRGCSFRQRDSQAGAFSLVFRFHLSIFLFVLLTTPFTGVTQAQERGVLVVKNE